MVDRPPLARTGVVPALVLMSLAPAQTDAPCVPTEELGLQRARELVLSEYQAWAQDWKASTAPTVLLFPPLTQHQRGSEHSTCQYSEEFVDILIQELESAHPSPRLVHGEALAEELRKLPGGVATYTGRALPPELVTILGGDFAIGGTIDWKKSPNGVEGLDKRGKARTYDQFFEVELLFSSRAGKPAARIVRFYENSWNSMLSRFGNDRPGRVPMGEGIDGGSVRILPGTTHELLERAGWGSIGLGDDWAPWTSAVVSIKPTREGESLAEPLRDLLVHGLEAAGLGPVSRNPEALEEVGLLPEWIEIGGLEALGRDPKIDAWIEVRIESFSPLSARIQVRRREGAKWGETVTIDHSIPPSLFKFIDAGHLVGEPVSSPAAEAALRTRIDLLLGECLGEILDNEAARDAIAAGGVRVGPLVTPDVADFFTDSETVRARLKQVHRALLERAVRERRPHRRLLETAPADLGGKWGEYESWKDASRCYVETYLETFPGTVLRDRLETASRLMEDARLDDADVQLETEFVKRLSQDATGSAERPALRLISSVVFDSDGGATVKLELVGRSAGGAISVGAERSLTPVPVAVLEAAFPPRSAEGRPAPGLFERK